MSTPPPPFRPLRGALLGFTAGSAVLAFVVTASFGSQACNRSFDKQAREHPTSRARGRSAAAAVAAQVAAKRAQASAQRAEKAQARRAYGGANDVQAKVAGAPAWADKATHHQLVDPKPPLQVWYVACSAAGASDDNDGQFPNARGKGKGPFKTIKRAIAAMSAGHATYVRAGTCHEGNIIIAKSGEPDQPIVLAGYRTERPLIDASQAREVRPAIVIESGASHIRIEGLRVTGSRSSGIGTNGRTETAYRDIVVRRCDAFKNKGPGVEIAAVDGFVVEDVHAFENGTLGIDIHGNKSGAISARHGLVRRVRVHHHVTDNAGWGLAINQGDHITVRDSIAYHNGRHGFDASDWPKGAPYSHRIVFANNYATDNGGAGFSVNSNSHDVFFIRNVAVANGAAWGKRGNAPGFISYAAAWRVHWYHNAAVDNRGVGVYLADTLQGSTYEPGAIDERLFVLKNNIIHNNGLGMGSPPAGLELATARGWKLVAEGNVISAPSGAPHAVAIKSGAGVSVKQLKAGRLGKGNVTHDPRIKVGARGKVTLLEGSPVVDKGVAIAGVKVCGGKPDIGPVERCP